MITRKRLTKVGACCAIALALGCGAETDEGVNQVAQDSHGVPQSLAQAKADALERAADELKDALHEMRRERQSHEAIGMMQREVQDLEAQARHWRAQARHR